MSKAREIKNKISSISNTKKITNAMELVAISKIKRTREKMEALQPYKRSIIKMVGHMALDDSGHGHPAFHYNENKNVGYIVIGTDRGLCGGLNVNLFRHLYSHIQKQEISDNSSIVSATFGRKALAFMKKQGVTIIGHSPAKENPKMEDVIAEIRQLTKLYMDKQIGKLFLVFNSFVNTLLQQPTVIQLLPIVKETLDSKYKWSYKCEPSFEDIQFPLIQRYLESVLYQSLLEAVACEQAARMVAMKSATENADQMLNDMKQLFNRQRQDSITQEISEIIGGANAIN